MIRILIAEDDELFAQTLEDFLTDEGFSVEIAHDGTSAEELCYEKNYDLLLLDINMNNLTGLQLLQNLRNNDNKTPAIYITSYKDKETLLKGFEIGADDYLKKPVDLDELLMRINALLKRSNKLLHSVNIAEFVYDKKQKVLIKDEQILQLAKKPALLLEILIENQNKIVSKEHIKSRLWEWDEAPSDGALRVYVNDLKKILGKDLIENIKGIGYRLAI